MSIAHFKTARGNDISLPVFRPKDKGVPWDFADDAQEIDDQLRSLRENTKRELDTLLTLRNAILLKQRPDLVEILICYAGERYCNLLINLNNLLQSMATRFGTSGDSLSSSVSP